MTFKIKEKVEQIEKVAEKPDNTSDDKVDTSEEKKGEENDEKKDLENKDEVNKELVIHYI